MDTLTVQTIYDKYVPDKYKDKRSENRKRIAIVDRLKEKRTVNHGILDEIIFMEYEDPVATAYVYNSVLELMARSVDIGEEELMSLGIRQHMKGWFRLPRLERVDMDSLQREIEEYEKVLMAV